MMSDTGTSLGEVGGILAGVTTLLATVGYGIVWLFGWKRSREESRAAKLQRWSEELEKREAKLDEERAAHTAGIERELELLKAWRQRFEVEHVALKTGYQLLASALRRADPGNAALRMADELLRAAFPPDPATPSDMLETLDRLGRPLTGEEAEPQ